ncbi:MAG: hypothetical protein BMS9Abin20_0983 [Acidimicrobiia bacterium]|nr:MAG: hypothetical protein BMS9Abin20_0983 [Acidimicrobiia bacterium]
METMQSVHTTETTDLTALSDADVEAYFADSDLEVVVVAHCDDVTCPTCFAPAPARAA